MSSDGLGKFLGRAHMPSLSTAINAAGEKVQAVRANLHLDPTALATPPQGGRPLGEYVMALAESDPSALASSLVLKTDEEFRLESDGTRKIGDDGEPLPPLWRPTAIRAVDVVDIGDAADSMLAAETKDGLPLAALWRGEELLDSVFAEQSSEVIRARCLAWLDRYLSGRFGQSGEGGRIVENLRRRSRLAKST
jgi:hypothetical protein